MLMTADNVPAETNRFGTLQDAREALSSLYPQGSPTTDVNTYGEFLLKDMFKMKKPFSMELIADLYKNAIIFTKVEGSDRFCYHSCIKLDEIVLRRLNKRDLLEIQHRTKPHNYTSINYQLKADPKVVQKWRKYISDCTKTLKNQTKEEITQQHRRPKFYVDK